jgi:hypothetical protein
MKFISQNLNNRIGLKPMKKYSQHLQYNNHLHTPVKKPAPMMETDSISGKWCQ